MKYLNINGLAQHLAQILMLSRQCSLMTIMIIWLFSSANMKLKFVVLSKNCWTDIKLVTDIYVPLKNQSNTLIYGQIPAKLMTFTPASAELAPFHCHFWPWWVKLCCTDLCCHYQFNCSELCRATALETDHLWSDAKALASLQAGGGDVLPTATNLWQTPLLPLKPSMCCKTQLMCRPERNTLSKVFVCSSLCTFVFSF